MKRLLYGELLPGMFRVRTHSLIISVIRHNDDDLRPRHTITLVEFNTQTKKIRTSNAGAHVESSFIVDSE